MLLFASQLRHCEVAACQLNRIEGQVDQKVPGWTRDPQPKPICRSRLAVVDDPRNEAVITDAVKRGLSGRYRFIRNDRHASDRIALEHDVACRSVLDEEQRPLSVTVLEVFDIHTDTRLEAVVNECASTGHESERRIVNDEHSVACALIEVPIDCQTYIVDVHGNVVQSHACCARC